MKKAIRLFEPFFSFINAFLPKKKNRLVFYSNLGFRDNVKALYDFAVGNGYNEKYELVCSVNDFKRYRALKIKNVRFTGNFAGLYYFLTSKYFFFSFGKYPVKPSKKQISVNSFHGTPLKKIGNLEKGCEKTDYDFFTYVIATSEMFAKITADVFGCDREKVLICGHPRNDVLFKKNDIPVKNGFSKMIFWLPTYRDECAGREMLELNDILPIFASSDALGRLNEVLKKSNILLAVKMHYFLTGKCNFTREYSNIKIITHEEFMSLNTDLYKTLSASEALITDYSSVYFDYMLLDRPMVFDISDIGKYGKDRGFIFDDPLEYMPGAKISDEKGLTDFICGFADGGDAFKEERSRINVLVNEYKNGGYCKRVFDFIGVKQ